MKKALIITCNDSYDYSTRTKYLESVLYEQGYLVEHLLSDFDHRSKKSYTASHGGKIHYIHVPHYSKNISIKRILSHIIFGHKVKKFVMSGDYELIYHCAPPNNTIKQISKCKKKKSFFLVTEIGDMWPESIPVGNNLKKFLFVPFFIWSGLRDKNLANSNVIIAECDLFRNAMMKNTKLDHIYTLYFCKKFYGENRTISYASGQEISLCYLGSINNIIDVDMIGKLINALKKRVCVKIHIIGEGENRHQLIETAEKNGAIVYYHGIVYDDNEKKQIMNQCHYALNIMKPEVFVGMTMKSLDYFSAGIPIINNIGGDVWRMVEEENVGFNINFEILFEIANKIYNTDKEQYDLLQKNVYLTHEKYFSINHFRNQIKEYVR